VLLLAWKTTSIDPSDSIVHQERYCRVTN